MSGQSQARKKFVFERDGKTCKRCGRALYLEKGSKENNGKMKGHIHHIKHRKDGGTNDPDNLLLTCWPCEAAWHRNDEKERRKNGQ